MSRGIGQESRQQRIKKVLTLAFVDTLSIGVSYFLALFLRFDFVFSNIPEEYLAGYLQSMPFWIVSTVCVFYLCRL